RAAFAAWACAARCCSGDEAGLRVRGCLRDCFSACLTCCSLTRPALRSWSRSEELMMRAWRRELGVVSYREHYSMAARGGPAGPEAYRACYSSRTVLAGR